MVLLDDGPLEQPRDCRSRVVLPASQGAAAIRLAATQTCSGRAWCRASAAVVLFTVSSVCLELVRSEWSGQQVDDDFMPSQNRKHRYEKKEHVLSCRAFISTHLVVLNIMVRHTSVSPSPLPSPPPRHKKHKTQEKEQLTVALYPNRSELALSAAGASCSALSLIHI